MTVDHMEDNGDGTVTITYEGGDVETITVESGQDIADAVEAHDG